MDGHFFFDQLKLLFRLTSSDFKVYSRVKRILRLIFVFCSFSGLLFAQDERSVFEKETGELKGTTDQFTNAKKQKAWLVKSTTLTFFNKRRLPDTTSFPTLNGLQAQANQKYVERLKLKSQNYLADFNTKSASAYFRNSLARDWQFTADGSGNNAGQLKNQAIGIFTGHPSLNKFDQLKLEAGNLRMPEMDDISTSDIKAKASEYLEKQLESENKAVGEIKEASKKLMSVEKASLYGQVPEDLSRSTKVYSEKIKQKIKDSLRLEQVEKYANALSTLAKKDVSEQDFINALNKVAPENNVLGKVDVNTHTLNADNGEQLKNIHGQIEDFDLSKMRLPDSILSELEPLRSYTVPDKYTRLVDSLRNEYSQYSNMALDEKKITEETKAVVAKRKPDFLQKFYAEAILGYLKDGKATLFQASPSAGYHFTDNLSVGLGPNVLGRIEGKKVSVTMGLRSYVKAEIFKQRAYLQVEDNVNPAPVKPEVLWKSPHNILGGGGILFPISGKLALNACILYRFNNHDTDPSSPWVFRLGLSSMKLK